MSSDETPSSTNCIMASFHGVCTKSCGGNAAPEATYCLHCTRIAAPSNPLFGVRWRRQIQHNGFVQHGAGPSRTSGNAECTKSVLRVVSVSVEHTNVALGGMAHMTHARARAHTHTHTIQVINRGGQNAA